jgi:hypothetical protein
MLRAMTDVCASDSCAFDGFGLMGEQPGRFLLWRSIWVELMHVGTQGFCLVGIHEAIGLGILGERSCSRVLGRFGRSARWDSCVRVARGVITNGWLSHC